MGTVCNSDRTVVNSVTEQLLCERDNEVCGYTGWYLGTECINDRTVINIDTGHLTVPAQLLVEKQPTKWR